MQQKHDLALKAFHEIRPALKLPTELWLLIFESVVASNIDPAGYCNHLNFPLIIRHLRFPSEYPSVISPSIRDLRLVCRYFNVLIGPSRSVLMMDPSVVIPPATRALHILSYTSRRACLERLLAYPPTSSRIVILNLLGYERSDWSQAATFDLLCDNAHLLSAVRTLAMRVHRTFYPIQNFWGRLNKSFPHLTCLIIHGYPETTYPDAAVEFKCLAVLEWTRPNLHPSLQFPYVRHLAIGSLRQFRPEEFARWPHLESLILQSLQGGESLDWALFPHLRLLGLHAQRIDAFPPLPRDHPLQHLYIFTGISPRDYHNRLDYDLQLKWLKKTIYQMPTVTRISVWFDKRAPDLCRWIPGDFREDDLELLGFEDVTPPNQNPQDGSHRVLRRLTLDPETQPRFVTTQDPAPRRIGFRTAWSMFMRFISRRLHL